MKIKCQFCSAETDAEDLKCQNCHQLLGNDNKIKTLADLKKSKKYFLQVSAEKLIWPKDSCPCCFQESDSNYKVLAKVTRGIGGKNSWWIIPHCSDCIKHIKLTKKIKYIWTICLVIGLFISISVSKSTHIMPFITVYTFLILSCFIAYKLSNKIKQEILKITKSNCTSLIDPIQYLRLHRYAKLHRTDHDFLFTNRNYAELFVNVNHGQKMSDLREI